MAQAAAEMGFSGLDLTVRKGGHVIPERVTEDLPRAVEAIRNAGLKADIMATDVTDADDPKHILVLNTASDLGFKYYRLGYVDYIPTQSQPQRLHDLNAQMHRLASLNGSLKLSGAYQNHSGTRIGGQIWEIHHLLDGINKERLGVQYDIRHAMVEGGESWENGLQLIAPKINCLVLKDYLWAKNSQGKWEVKNVPLGQGMVDFKYYFQKIKALGLEVPFILHCEYDLGGAEHGLAKLSGIKAADVFNAMRQDLAFAKKNWTEA